MTVRHDPNDDDDDKPEQQNSKNVKINTNIFNMSKWCYIGSVTIVFVKMTVLYDVIDKQFS